MLSERLRIGIAVALAASGIVVGIGAASIAFAEDHTDEAYTIDVDEMGFTPGMCQAVDRPVSIRFRNAGSSPRRVIVPDIFPGQPPLWSSGLLQPGDISTGYVQIFAGGRDFFDADELTHVFTLNVPKIGPAVASCTPDPIARPAPFIRCRGNVACNVAMAVASDR